MIVTCEKCNTSFDLDDEMIRGSGSEVKCSECEHVFTVHRPAADEEPESPPEPEGGAAEPTQAEEPVEEEFDIDALGLEGEPEEAVEEPAAEETLELAGGADEEGLDLGDFNLEDEPEAEGPAEVKEEAAAEESLEPAGGAAEEELDLEAVGLEEESEEAVEEPAAEETPEPAGDAVAEELDLDAISRAVEEAAQEPRTVSDGAPREEEVLDFDLLEPEGETAAEEPGEQELDFDGLGFDEEITPEEEVTVEEAPGSEPEPVEEESLVQEFEPEEEPGPVDKIPMPPPAAAKAPPAGKSVSKPLILVLLLLLAGGGLGGYVFMKGEVPFLKGGIPFLGKQEPAVVDPGNLHITLLDQKITAEFVTNSTAGGLFVIKGIARNDYPEARNFIRVRGILYAQDGKSVQNKTSYCGNVLSDSQLQTLDKTAMEMRWQNRFGVGKTNFNISSGTEVPFMVVFSDLPQDFGEFGVEVVSSAKAQ